MPPPPSPPASPGQSAAKPTSLTGAVRGGPAHSPRSGAHRPRRPLWHDVAPALVVLAAVLALLIGVLVLKDSVLGSSSTSSSGAPPASDQDQQPPAPTAPSSSPTSATPTSAASSTSAPTVNRTARVHVWNGTGRSGLAAGAAQKLSGRGWRASPAGNQSGYAGRTTVYYPRAALRATAEAVAQALGGYRIRAGTAYGSSGVVVVLGSDYHG